jgi:FAD/FMN-containing dehydrogenase
VKFVTSRNIPFLATGGRHGYTTTVGALHDGLAIDLSHFNSLKVNNATGIITVGPGVRVGQIIDPLFNAGFDIRKLQLHWSSTLSALALSNA